MNKNTKEPLLTKKSIELDKLTKQGTLIQEPKNIISSPKRTNLKKKFGTVPFNKKANNKNRQKHTHKVDFYHDASLFSKIFFSWVSKILKVILISILFILWW